MDLQEIKISHSARLWAVRTRKFKKNVLSMTAILPLGPETTPLDLLFPRVLMRGIDGYPENADLKKRLETLYDTRIREGCSYFGDSLKIGFTADFLDDRVVESPIPCCRPARRYLAAAGARLNRFCENENLAWLALCDSIRPRLTQPSMLNRCWKIICAGEPYGYSVTGTRSRDNRGGAHRKIPAGKEQRLTFFYVGSKPAGRLPNCWPRLPAGA